MIEVGRLDTPIQLLKKSEGTTSNGFGNQDNFVPVSEDVILCNWKNKFGSEAVTSKMDGQIQPARIRLYYYPGITEEMLFKRIDDGAIFEIVTIDDVENRHMVLEILIKRYVKG